VNKNGIPFDPRKPAATSGIRIGSPNHDSRHGRPEAREIGKIVGEALDQCRPARAKMDELRGRVGELTARYDAL
jgi:glycine hydroxymethyltransferase